MQVKSSAQCTAHGRGLGDDYYRFINAYQSDAVTTFFPRTLVEQIQ